MERYQLCYTCGSCDAECPVNRRTNKLSPRKIVRFYLLGLVAEAIEDEAIWRCVRCDRCVAVCPMAVRPVEWVKHLQDLSVQRGVAGRSLPSVFFHLRARLQRARYSAVEALLRGDECDGEEVWHSAEVVSRYASRAKVEGARLPKRSLETVSLLSSYGAFTTNLRRCWSCGSCSNACPASVESALFSPMRLFRMLNYGALMDVLHSPGIWLCIDCGRCMDACPQSVRGLWVIRLLRERAFQEGVVDDTFFQRWTLLDRALHQRFAESVGALLKAHQ